MASARALCDHIEMSDLTEDVRIQGMSVLLIFEDFIGKIRICLSNNIGFYRKNSTFQFCRKNSDLPILFYGDLSEKFDF